MNLPAGAAIINDSNASGGQAVRVSTPVTLSGTINLPSAATSLDLVYRSTSCPGGWPKVSVVLDSTQLISGSARGTSYAVMTANTSAGAGAHTIKISYAWAGKQCTPLLYIDVINIHGTTVTQPAPTVSLNAMPNSVTAGQSSTLTWNSTNATGCTASGNWSGSKPLSGSASTGALNNNATYTLNCTGPGGSTSTTANISVGPVPPVTDPIIKDSTTYNNATFTKWVALDNHHDISFINSTFQAGVGSSNGNDAHNISLTDSSVTNPSSYCVKMGALDTNWSFLRVKIHDCGSMGVVWNRLASQPPQQQWGYGFSFIGGEVWNTGLNDGEHAFYINVRDVHIAGVNFHDFKRSAISLRFGGAVVEYNDFHYNSTYEDAVTDYDYDGTAYKNIQVQYNKIFGSNPGTGSDMWIGTSEGPLVNYNPQTFVVSNNCFPGGVKMDSALSPRPSLTVGDTGRCSDTGAAYWRG